MKKLSLILVLIISTVCAKAQEDLDIVSGTTGTINVVFYAVDVSSPCGGPVGISNTFTIPSTTPNGTHWNYSYNTSCSGYSTYPPTFWATDPTTSCSGCTWAFAYAVVSDACTSSFTLGNCSFGTLTTPNTDANPSFTPCGSIIPVAVNWFTGFTNNSCGGEPIAGFSF